MIRRSHRAVVVLAVAAVTPIVSVRSPHAQQPTLAARVEAIRAGASLPAVAAATFKSTGTIETAAVGVRRLGTAAAVTAGDRWHIGSLTKSFTSALVATFVERGQLSWTTTLGELLGTQSAQKFAPVTLANLLSHRAGLPPNVPALLALALSASSEPVTGQRRRIVETVLSGDPTSAPGEAYAYSNVGYIVAGALLEAKTGRSWEDLLRSEVLSRLSLSSAGFGPPGVAGALTEPRGHRSQATGGLVGVEPGPGADNPPFLGPAGTLHMTVTDLARWGQAHLAGERGQDGLLRTTTFRYLHQPPRPEGDYALGWVVQRKGAQRVIWHNGSNTMWYVFVAFDPDADRGVVLVTNGGIGAAKPIDAAGLEMLRGDDSGA